MPRLLVLRLYEFDPETDIQWNYAGCHEQIIADITYISSAYQQDGYVVLGVKVREIKP